MFVTDEKKSNLEVSVALMRQISHIERRGLVFQILWSSYSSVVIKCLSRSRFTFSSYYVGKGAVF